MLAPFDSELGDFVEEICADLCRLECAATVGCEPAQVSVERELALGTDAFADILVEAPGAAPFFVENKLAYAPADPADPPRRKYGQPRPAAGGAPRPAGRAPHRLVVWVAREWRPPPAEFERELRAAVAPGLTVDLWDVAELF